MVVKERFTVFGVKNLLLFTKPAACYFNAALMAGHSHREPVDQEDLRKFSIKFQHSHCVMNVHDTCWIVQKPQCHPQSPLNTTGKTLVLMVRNLMT